MFFMQHDNILLRSIQDKIFQRLKPESAILITVTLTDPAIHHHLLDVLFDLFQQLHQSGIDF